MTTRTICLIGVCVLATLLGCRETVDHPREAVAPSAADLGALRWLAAGGGDLPENNQVSIEQDLALAGKTFGPSGLLLYAGGPKTAAVQILERRPSGDALRLELAELFDPRPGRDARYRRTELLPSAAATLDTILAELRRAAETDQTTDFLIYLAGHGNLGETAMETGFLTWGGEMLTPRALEEVLDTAALLRRFRVVMTSCFSGGFAEILFTHADGTLGAAPGDRCGLFAATWDQESSGCDPNPDRGAQDGYGVHFLHALRGEDRAGRKLPLAELDLDGDGQISLLEAHTRVRLASGSIDIPTTTSERWLRARAVSDGPRASVSLPEEEVVVERLSKRLGNLDSARLALEAVTEELKDARDALEEAQGAEGAAYRIAAAELLSRWPVLNDPWHPLFERTLEKNRRLIRAALEKSSSLQAHSRAAAAVTAAQLDVDELMLRRAALMRLVRAADNLQLAGYLKEKGGSDWQVFERLRACENSLPPVDAMK